MISSMHNRSDDLGRRALPSMSLRTRYRYLSAAALVRRHVENRRRSRILKVPLTSSDKAFQEFFLCETATDAERYSALFSYLVEGFVYYLSEDCAHAYYPGASSTNGAKTDAVEGFCRILPMISAWISSGRPTVVLLDDGHTSVDLVALARAGLLAGTDPRSKGYWGHIRDYDQLIVEAGDVALSIWLLRDSVWADLASPEKARIADWLLSVHQCRVSDSNWHVYPIMINEVLRALGLKEDNRVSRDHYQRLKSFYLGDGWFSDGPRGRVDYYNAWSIHYSLYWLSMIDPAFDPVFIDESLDLFTQSYKYLFSKNGIPIFGRSICYRMAAPAPLVAAAIRGVGTVTPGLARRAVDGVWRYFVRMGAVSCGKVSQGYWQDDIRLLDNYSGPASCLWSLRSLVVAFHAAPSSDFWLAPTQKLPIEEGDYSITVPAIRWTIRGRQDTGNVQILIDDANRSVCSCVKGETILRKAAAWILARPFRPPNMSPKYRLHEYSSARPFFCDTPDGGFPDLSP